MLSQETFATSESRRDDRLQRRAFLLMQATKSSGPYVFPFHHNLCPCKGRIIQRPVRSNAIARHPPGYPFLSGRYIVLPGSVYEKRTPGDCSPEVLCSKRAATYSPTLHRSTIGAGGLNFSVRNGKRWNTAAITAQYFVSSKRLACFSKQGQRRMAYKLTFSTQA